MNHWIGRHAHLDYGSFQDLATTSIVQGLNHMQLEKEWLVSSFSQRTPICEVRSEVLFVSLLEKEAASSLHLTAVTGPQAHI